jgi:hypothetical protein
VALSSSLRSHPFAVLVEEALSAVLAPARRGDVLFDAMHRAGIDEIPDHPVAMRSFVEGALFTAIARELETEQALELTSQIRATLEVAFATEVPDDRPISSVLSRTTRRAIIATRASLVGFLLQDALGDYVRVHVVETQRALIDQLRALREPLLVVVDRRNACVDEQSCAVLGAALDPRSTVVWWGASEEERLRVRRGLAEGPRAIVCESELRLAELGGLCRNIILH